MAGAPWVLPLAGSARAAGPEQLDCPIEDHYRTNAETQEGVLARMVEHIIDRHPGGLPDVVVEAVKGITGRFK